MILKIFRMPHNRFVPEYKAEGAAGMDLCAAIDEEITDPVQMYLNDVFTVTVNLAGIPAISVPFGYTNDGLPLGLQLMSSHFREDLLFQIGSKLELESGFKYWKE